MAVVKGFMATAALKKGSGWGTAATVGAGNGIEILTESISGSSALIENRHLRGDSQQRVGVAGPETYSGSIEMDAVYETVHVPLCFVFGTNSTSGTQSPYTHTITILDDLEGVYATLALKADTLEVHEYPSVKFNGFELSASSGEPVKIRFDLIPNDINLNTVSGNNTLTTMTNVTYASDVERVLFSQAVVRVIDSTTTLTSGHAVSLEAFMVNMSRNLQGKITTTFPNSIAEPQPGDFIKVGGSFTVPYHNATAQSFHAWAIAKTALHADIIFTAASGSKTFNVYLSGIQLDGKPSVSGPGAANVTFNFTAHAIASAQTNFPSADAIGITVLNSQSTSPLA